MQKWLRYYLSLNSLPLHSITAVAALWRQVSALIKGFTPSILSVGFSAVGGDYSGIGHNLISSAISSNTARRMLLMTYVGQDL